jgi:hypothetical protein
MPLADRIDDGFSTRISFADFPSVSFEEIEVTPPSMMGGGANDVTNMRNTALRTKSPKKLKTMGDMQLLAAYAPEVFSTIFDMINHNQEITIEWPDGDTYKVWGWVDEFKPNAVKEGERATAQVTIICSNHDNDLNEIEPDFTGHA